MCKKKMNKANGQLMAKRLSISVLMARKASHYKIRSLKYNDSNGQPQSSLLGKWLEWLTRSFSHLLSLNGTECAHSYSKTIGGYTPNSFLTLGSQPAETGGVA